MINISVNALSQYLKKLTRSVNIEKIDEKFSVTDIGGQPIIDSYWPGRSNNSIIGWLNIAKIQYLKNGFLRRIRIIHLNQ